MNDDDDDEEEGARKRTISRWHRHQHHQHTRQQATGTSSTHALRTNLSNSAIIVLYVTFHLSILLRDELYNYISSTGPARACIEF